jgi:D-ribulokinase
LTHFCIGLDLGTSGVRAEVMGPDGSTMPCLHRAWPDAGRVPAEPAAWWQVVRALLRDAADRIPPEPVAIAVDGTSATLLALGANGQPLGPSLMYDDARAVEQAGLLSAVAPREAAVHGPASSAAKLLWLRDQDLLRTRWPCCTRPSGSPAAFWTGSIGGTRTMR